MAPSILTMILPTASTGHIRPAAKLDPTKFPAQIRLDGGRPDRGIIALAGGCVRTALFLAGLERIVHGCGANDRLPGGGMTTALE